MTDICQQVEPPLTDYGNGHLAACHHPLNVDKETLARVSASPRHTPEAADASATPSEPSGPSRPVPEASDR
jgi:peptide/nickel transport system ATP-binding protein/oligopeptide transport system ATP-binding protein